MWHTTAGDLRGNRFGCMAHDGTASSGTAPHAAIVSRFFLFGSALGFFIGLFEAYRLWTTPRIIPLLVPDIGYVIWFLAPLVDMIFFGLVGLGLGLCARRSARKDAFVAVLAGVAIAFVALMLFWFHFDIALNPFHYQEVGYPLAFLCLSVGVSFLVIGKLPGGLVAVFTRWTGRWQKPLAWGLAVGALVMLAAVGKFTARPSFAGPAAVTDSPSTRAPNIVFITLDTVRADHLSAYGYRRPTTPNLERFARTGVLFENAIAPTSWTLASHASMFTGLLPQQHGADFGVPLVSSPWTLAEILRSRGYQTAGFVANNCYLHRGWGIAQGFETYDDYRNSVLHNFSQTLVGNALVQPIYQNVWSFDWMARRNAARLNSQIFRWFRRRPDRPLFLFINYYDAHEPYVSPPPYNHLFGHASLGMLRKFHQALVLDKGRPVLSPQERNSVIAAYDNTLAYMDDQVGRLLHFLHQTPGWQNTIVIITSDHGDEFGAHGSYDHGRNLYRGVLHVPLVIAGPGVPKDVRIKHIVGIRQLFSTVLDLAGGGQTPFSRTSLARFWNPDFKPAPFDDDVVSELVPLDDIGARHAMISLTTPQWQYIEHHSGRQQLYNWITDPDEQKSLAAAPADQAALQSLHARLVSLVANSTGPWTGREYLLALGLGAGKSGQGLLFPHPVQPGNQKDQFRIGMAQAYFKSQASAPVRPSRSERDIIQSLPYQ